MQQLTPTDLQFVVRRLPKDVRELMMANTLFLGGGFIRETIANQGGVKDIDLFGPDSLRLALYGADLFEKRLAAGGTPRRHTTPNALTLLCPPRLPVQFIKRWTFDEPEQLVASFDFTVCQAAVWYDATLKSWMSACSDRFYADLAARRLVYTFPQREEEAGGSMMRVLKLLQRGYSIQAQSLAGVIARLTHKVHEGRLREGTEQERAQVITGLLREVDPLLVVDGLEVIDEHGAPGEDV